MKLDNFQKAKVVLGISLFAFFCAILFIPHIIDSSVSWASEDTLEVLLLVLSFFSLIYVFWHYDYVVQKKEEENFHLSSKLKDKEKELLDTFQYLGKINVRFSVIQDLIDRMKQPAPVNQDDLSKTLKSLLDIACSATGQKVAWVRIVNTECRKVLAEEIGGDVRSIEGKENQINVRRLLEIYKNKRATEINGFKVYYSGFDNHVKAFLILPFNKDSIEQSEDFLKAVANQCEILFSLFDSQYYRPKKKRHGRKK